MKLNAAKWRTENFTTVEVVKASQPHFTCCLLMRTSRRHWTGRQIFSGFLCCWWNSNWEVAWDSLRSSVVHNAVVCSCGNFLKVSKLLAQVRSDSQHRKDFRFAQACTRGNPQHQPNTKLFFATVSQQFLVSFDVKKPNSRNFRWQVTLFFLVKSTAFWRVDFNIRRDFSRQRRHVKWLQEDQNMLWSWWWYTQE